MIALGFALIFVNLLGYVLEPNIVEENDKNIGTSKEGYRYSTQGTKNLLEMLDKPMDRFDFNIVNNKIFASIVHSDKRKIQIYENWVLWSGGKIYGPLSRTQNPIRIVLGGKALCSEVSAVFNRIATLNNFDARFIGLNGHVVSEIRTDDGWHVVDPDFGVTYQVGLKVLETREGVPLMREALSGRGYNEETIDKYIHLFQTSSDNTVFEVGVALSPRLYAIEQISEYLKWIIPIILVLLGIVVLPKNSNNSIHSHENSAALH